MSDFMMEYNNLTRASLVDRVSQEMGLPYKQSETLIVGLMQHITDRLVAGETVKLAKFGVFSVVERKEMIGRNIKANSFVNIPKRHVVTFKPSKLMKNRVEKSGAQNSEIQP